MPEASVNLVSIPVAVRRGIVFDFAEEGCRVSKGGELVTIAPPNGGVYVIAPSPGVAAALSAMATPQLGTGATVTWATTTWPSCRPISW